MHLSRKTARPLSSADKMGGQECGYPILAITDSTLHTSCNLSATCPYPFRKSCNFLGQISPAVSNTRPGGGGGVQIWFLRGCAADRMPKPVPIRVMLGGTWYPWLRVFSQENCVFVDVSDLRGDTSSIYSKVGKSGRYVEWRISLLNNHTTFKPFFSNKVTAISMSGKPPLPS